MGETQGQSVNAEATEAGGLRFLQDLPWERMTTWAVVLLVLYLLRGFFFILVATFLMCYFIRQAVNLVLRRVPASARTAWLERLVTMLAFVVLLGGLVVFMALLISPAVEQGRMILARVESTTAQEEFERILQRTIGRYLFFRRYGTAKDPRYQEGLAANAESPTRWEGLYLGFPVFRAGLLDRLDTTVAHRTKYDDRRIAELIGEPEFRTSYERWHRNPMQILPFSYQDFLALNEAYAKGPDAFGKELTRQSESFGSEPLERASFEANATRRLALDWWSNDPLGVSLHQNLDEVWKGRLANLGDTLRQFVRLGLVVPVQIAISLILSLLITFDAPNISRKLQALRETRIRKYYDEVAPALVVFAKLIGKAFETQLVIGVVGAVLALPAFWLIGIDSKYFLSAIVFVTNLIPVLGGIICSVIVTLMALLQPNGSVGLAIAGLLVVMVIHAITGFLVAPRIVGQWFHLHPVLALVILLIGEYFFGIWGLLLGVPLAVYVLRILVLNVGIPGITDTKFSTG